MLFRLHLPGEYAHITVPHSHVDSIPSSPYSLAPFITFVASLVNSFHVPFSSAKVACSCIFPSDLPLLRPPSCLPHSFRLRIDFIFIRHISCLAGPWCCLLHTTCHPGTETPLANTFAIWRSQVVYSSGNGTF